jgi:hypothetical protein
VRIAILAPLVEPVPPRYMAEWQNPTQDHAAATRPIEVIILASEGS